MPDLSTMSDAELEHIAGQGSASSVGSMSDAELEKIANGNPVASSAESMQSKRGDYGGYCERYVCHAFKSATGQTTVHGVNLQQNAIDVMKQAQKNGVGFPLAPGHPVQPGDIVYSGRMGHGFGHAMIVGNDGVVRSDLAPGVGQNMIDWVIRPDAPRGGGVVEHVPAPTGLTASSPKPVTIDKRPGHDLAANIKASQDAAVASRQYANDIPGAVEDQTRRYMARDIASSMADLYADSLGPTETEPTSKQAAQTKEHRVRKILSAGDDAQTIANSLADMTVKLDPVMWNKDTPEYAKTLAGSAPGGTLYQMAEAAGEAAGGQPSIARAILGHLGKSEGQFALEHPLIAAVNIIPLAHGMFRLGAEGAAMFTKLGVEGSRALGDKALADAAKATDPVKASQLYDAGVKYHQISTALKVGKPIGALQLGLGYEGPKYDGITNADVHGPMLMAPGTAMKGTVSPTVNEFERLVPKNVPENVQPIDNEIPSVSGTTTPKPDTKNVPTVDPVHVTSDHPELHQVLADNGLEPTHNGDGTTSFIKPTIRVGSRTGEIKSVNGTPVEPTPQTAPVAPQSTYTHTAPNGPKYIGSLNRRTMSVSPEIEENMRQIAERHALDDKEVATDAAAAELAKSFNLSYDDMHKWPLGERPIRPEHITNPKTWAKAWDDAVSNLHMQAQRELIEAQDAAADARAYHDAEPTNMTKAAVAVADIEQAKAQLTAEMMQNHDDTLSSISGAVQQGRKNTPIPTRGTGYVNSLQQMPSLDEALGTPKPTSQAKSDGPVVPDVPNPKTGKTGGNRNPRPMRERTVNDDDYQAAIARLKQGSVSHILKQFIAGEEGHIDFNALGGAVGDIVTVGKYHWESGLQNFDRWRAAVEKTLDHKLDNADADKLYRYTRAAIQQDINAKQKNATIPLFKDQLKELGRIGSAQFAHDIDPVIFDKIVTGKPLSAFSTAERAEIAKHFEANTPKGNRNGSKQARNLAKQIAMDAKAARKTGKGTKQPKVPDHPVIRSLKQGLGKNYVKFTEDIDAQHPSLLDRLKSGDITDDEATALGDAYVKHSPNRNPAAVTKGQEALRQAVKDARTSFNDQDLTGYRLQRDKNLASDDPNAPVDVDVPPTDDELFLSHISGPLGGAEGAEAFRSAVGVDLFDKLVMDKATPVERARAAREYEKVREAKDSPTAKTKSSNAKSLATAVDAYRTAKRISEAAAKGPKEPPELTFERLVGRRVSGGMKVAWDVRTNLETDALGKSAIDKLMKGDDLTNTEGRRLARAIDHVKRTTPKPDPDAITALLTKLMRDARTGRLGYDNPLEAAKTQMLNDANAELKAMGPNADPARIAEETAKRDAKVKAISEDLADIDPHDGAAIAKVMMKHDDMLNQYKQFVLGNVISGTDTGVKIAVAHPATIIAEEMRRWLFGDKAETIAGIRAGLTGLRERGIPEARQILHEGSTASHLSGKSWYKPTGERIPVESRLTPHRVLLRAHGAFYQLMQTYNVERGLHLYAMEDGRARGLTGQALKDHVIDVTLHPENYKEVAEKAIEFGKEETQTTENPVAQAISQMAGKSRAGGFVKGALLPVSNLPLNAVQRMIEMQTGLLSSRAMARMYAKLNRDATPEMVAAYQKKVFRRGAIGAGIAAAGALGELTGAITPPDRKHGRYVGRVNAFGQSFDVPAGNVGAALDTGAELAHMAHEGNHNPFDVLRAIGTPIVEENPLTRSADTISGLAESAVGNARPQDQHALNAAVGSLLVEHMPLSGLTRNAAAALDRATGGGVRKKSGPVDYMVDATPYLRQIMLPPSLDKMTGQPYPQGVLHSYPQVPKEILEQLAEMDREAKDKADNKGSGSYALDFLRSLAGK